MNLLGMNGGMLDYSSVKNAVELLMKEFMAKNGLQQKKMVRYGSSYQRGYLLKKLFERQVALLMSKTIFLPSCQLFQARA